MRLEAIGTSGGTCLLIASGGYQPAAIQGVVVQELLAVEQHAGAQHARLGIPLQLAHTALQARGRGWARGVADGAGKRRGSGAGALACHLAPHNSTHAEGARCGSWQRGSRRPP